MSETVINLTEAAKELVRTLSKNGFNGVYVSAGMETTVTREEWEEEHPDGPSYEEHRRDYACFIADADLYAIVPMGHRDSPYINVEYEEDQLREDFMEHVRKVFGPGITINVHCRGREFEVIRESEATK